ncbi:hypothetical protein CKA49_37590, partial [Pseudomonas aeruginosa]
MIVCCCSSKLSSDNKKVTASATGRTIYDNEYTSLVNYLAQPNQLENFDEFIHACRQQHDEMKQTLEQGRDRLLEMHSNGGEQGVKLAEKIGSQDNDPELVNFAL